jgi:uncharacterized membrane protein YfcA
VSLSEIIILTACAAIAGAVNALAGGGMLVAYPVLVAFGLSPIAANATATVALLSGGIGAQLGYRKEMKGSAPFMRGLVIPCIVGGSLGAFFLLKAQITRLALQIHAKLTGSDIEVSTDNFAPTGPTTALLVAQFAISIYIGYFGAGAGALMLANFGFAGLINIHQMNGLKLWSGMLTNVTAALIFALQPSLVSWPMVFVMTFGSIVGGYLSSRIAQRVSQASVRIAIVVIGVAMAAWLVYAAVRARGA